MSLCGCGCGGEASPGKRFIQGHNKKDKQPPELPFCACGCGGRVSKLGNKYINGHNQRGKPSPMKGKKPWCTGLTKKTNNSLRESGKKISKTKKEFFASDEGQQWLDEHNRGENSPRYGKKPWNYGKRKGTDMRVKKYGETTRKKYESKEIKVWCDGKTKEDEPRLMQLSESLLVFYQSDEGIGLKEKFSEDRKGEGNSFFNKEHTNEAKLEMKKKHSTDEAKQKHREFRKKQKFPKHHTNIELRCEELSYKNSLSVIYTGDGSFWIPKRNNGTKVCNPDFVLYANGKKFVIELLGNYWHSPLINNKISDTHYKDKKKHYKRYGWIPIFIWESDIMRPDGEKFFLSELKKAGAL